MSLDFQMADGGSAASTSHDGVHTGTVHQPVMPPNLANVVLDALPDTIAVLDQSGTIVAVNEAWERFARENGGTVSASGIGTDYLAVCRAASHDETAQQVFDGLRTILSGTQMCFVIEYPCHSPTRQQWFHLRAMPALGKNRGAIVIHSDITARKLFGQMLAEQKRRYEGLLAASPDHIFLLDLAGHFTFVNPAAAAIIVAANGRPADEIVGHTARELGLPPEFVRQFEHQQTRARAGKAATAETSFPDLRGGRRFEYILSPIYAENGQLEALAGITRDIDERTHLLEAAKTAQQEATRQAQELEAVFAAIPDGSIVFDQRGRVTRVGGLDQALLGSAHNERVAERAERLGLRDANGMPLAAEQTPAMRVLQGEVLSADHPVDVHAAVPDGRQIELSVTGGPIRGAKGRSAGGVLIYRDVTQERQATHRYQATIESAPDATVVADADGRIKIVNRQTEDLFGYSREDLVGKPVEQLIPERFHSAHRQHRAAFAAAPSTRPMGASLSLFGRRSDGTEFPVEASLSPLADGEAQIIVSIRDVSELQRVHAARREAEQANMELRQLLTLTDTAMAHLELNDLLPDLLGRVRNVMGVENAAILLLTDDGQQLVMRAACGLEEAVKAGVKIPLGQGFAGRIAASRTPLIVEDLSTFPEVNPFVREKLHAAVGVPLVLRERVLGVLHVGAADPHHFTEQDVQLLQRAAERVAVAVERAQMFQAEQEARREAETALARARASESRFQRLVDSGIIGIVVSDRERVIDANDAYLQILGYTRQDLQDGKPTQQVVSTQQDLVAANEYGVSEALKKGFSQPFEREYTRKDGSRVSVLLGVALLQREPPVFVSFVVDLSNQKQLQSSLRESEQLFGAMFEQAAVGMARVAPGGNWLDVNRRLCEIVGYSWDELMEHTFQDITYADDLAGDLEYVRQMLAGERNSYEMEKRYVRKDGTLVWAYLTVSLVRDAVGVPQCFIAVVEDISARKRAEREREEARASELAAQEVTQQLDQFFAMAAHDIRSPLTTLSGSVQIASLRAQRLVAALEAPDGQAVELASRLVAALDNAEASSERLLHMVAMLFDVARARTGTLSLTLAPCDLGALVRDQVGALQAAAPDRTIHLDLPDHPVQVMADADRLGQVVTNYLANALKYSPDDQPIAVRLVVTDGLAVVSVQDHGPGLPVREQRQIWELYHRAPGVAVQSSAGVTSGSLGLGLHICKRLVELHSGGQVGVESVVGKGSTFWFRLPVAAEPTSEAPSVP